jgi:D-sedoheptulose 7-phosphate isomerase
METATVTAEILARRPELEGTVPDFVRLCEGMKAVFEAGGKLLVAGNGGSAADAQHIVAELMKSFERRRPLPDPTAGSLENLPHGKMLARHLEAGLPAISLGMNHSLTSAIGNDFEEPHLEYAQELLVLGSEGDALLAISTSGRARNILYAMVAAQAKGLFVVALTGPTPGEMGELADLTVSVPAQRTTEVQELHEVIYHGMCRALEHHFFGSV